MATSGIPWIPIASPVVSIALDFVNVHQGFWDLGDEGERALFAATTDLILGEPRFRIPDTSHFLVSSKIRRTR